MYRLLDTPPKALLAVLGEIRNIDIKEFKCMQRKYFICKRNKFDVGRIKYCRKKLCYES